MQIQLPINYSILRKYNVEIELLAQLKESKGEDISSVYHTTDTNFEDYEEFQAFNDGYERLLDGHNLLIHKQHLLFFAGTLYQAFEESHLAKEDFREALKTLKKIVTLLKIQKDNPIHQLKITIASKVFMDKVDFDQALFIQPIIQPIIDNLIKTIRSPIYNLQLHQLLLGVEPTYEAFKNVLDSVKLSKASEYIQTLALYSHTILNYLNQETTFKTSVGLIISDDQARFLYDFLELFLFINNSPDIEKHLDSEPKDYIRSLLKNSIR